MRECTAQVAGEEWKAAGEVSAINLRAGMMMWEETELVECWDYVEKMEVWSVLWILLENEVLHMSELSKEQHEVCQTQKYKHKY